MPYPSEHSARLRDPGVFEESSFRRINLAPGIDAIIGNLTGQKETTTQAIRFAKSSFTPEQAQEWLEKHNEKTISFEPASEGKKDAARRVDNIGSFHRAERQPNGFLRVPATITRAGVFEYRQPDGSVRRELRPPSEVFSERSLDSLKSLVITNDHPEDIFVIPENAKKEQAGFSSERLKIDRAAGTIDTILTFTTKEVLDAIDAGKQELSCGYACNLEMTAGVDPVYGRYDAIQRDIIYNHIALVDKARGGEKLILHLDSADAIGENISQSRGTSMKYKIDEHEIECSEEDYKKIDAAMKKRDGKIQELETKSGTMKKDADDKQKRVDALTTENGELKSRVDAGGDKLQAKIDALTSENSTLKTENAAFKGDADKRRLDALAARVAPYMPKEFKPDGLDRSGIMSAFVKHVDPKSDLAGRSADYLEARVDHELARLDSSEASNRKFADDLLNAPRRDGDATDPLARKDAADKDARDAWKKIPEKAA